MLRRDFLKIALGSTAFVVTGASVIESCASPTETPVDTNAPNPLKIPLVFSGGSLVASYGTSPVWRGTQSDAILVNGRNPAPTILLQSGAMLNAAFVNGLGEPSILHWHGLNAPADMDGHPRTTIASGQSYQYSYPIQQRAGTYWYHAHPDEGTAKQAYMGLAGAFVITDTEEQSLGLPSGKFDVPLLLQDKRKGADNKIEYNPDEEDILTGFLGNHVIVSGTANAYLEVEQNLYRFRIINASNARVYKIGFADHRTFQLIATDGGLIEKPESLQSFNLSPGERAEIIVDFTKAALSSSVKLVSLPYEFNSSHQGATYPQGLALDILDCRVAAKASTQPVAIPATLSTIDKLSGPVRTRTFALTMDHSKHTGVHMINDLVFQMDRVDERVPLGDVELWEFQNTADAFHSMHVHGTQFQVVERLYADPITPVDYGWKDTVLVYPNETVRVLIRFSDYRGLYLLHCHTLEHEDDGMMINIEVV